jgi:hypothetical protein
MKNYTTKDLYIASLLYAQGKSLNGLNKDEKNYWFEFDDYDSCNQMVSDYWKRKVQVDAKSFVEAIKNLKSMIFSEMEREKLPD